MFAKRISSCVHGRLGSAGPEVTTDFEAKLKSGFHGSAARDPRSRAVDNFHSLGRGGGGGGAECLCGLINLPCMYCVHSSSQLHLNHIMHACASYQRYHNLAKMSQQLELWLAGWARNECDFPFVAQRRCIWVTFLYAQAG